MPYFLWVGIFNVMVIAQFWAFVNDIYSYEQGKRLFPIVGLGSSLGAWLGSVFAGDGVRALGPYPLMVLAGGDLDGVRRALPRWSTAGSSMPTHRKALPTRRARWTRSAALR